PRNTRKRIRRATASGGCSRDNPPQCGTIRPFLRMCAGNQRQRPGLHFPWRHSISFRWGREGDTNFSEMQHKLATWATADPTRRFDRLLRLITDRNWLAEAARIVLASRGAGTPGLDGMDKRRLGAHLDHHLERLRSTLLDGTYRPTPVKRIY